MSSGLYLSGDGRMGSLLSELLDAGDTAARGLRRVESLSTAAVVIDYSHPDWTGPLLDQLLDQPRPLVLGTTGLTAKHEAKIDRLAQSVPVIAAANTGTGINVLRGLVEAAASALGSSWDIEIVEMHHKDKVDAPSGTAWMLLEAAASATGSHAGTERSRAVASRLGETGARPAGSIGIQSVRGGDVVGEHTVYLVGPGERIELAHRAWDRETFARGGLRSARWLLEEGRTPGRYAMADVLGLGSS